MNEYENIKNNNIVLLFAEDSPSDQNLVRRAVDICKINILLKTVDNGEEALMYLKGQGVFEDRNLFPFPDILLLDLNMPCLDGKQVLAAVRADEKLKALPVLIFTTSNNEQDVIDLYKLGGNAYIVKPSGITEFFEAVRKIEDFWLNLSLLPHIK